MNFPLHPQAGVCLHLSSLPGAYGIGEIGHTARTFIDTLAAINLRVWQFLPSGPTGYGNSPYQALSTFAGNELLLDTDNLVELGLLPAHAAARLHMPAMTHIDFGQLIPRKHAMLAEVGRRFATHARAALRSEFETFLQQHDQRWLHDYAMYRLLKTHAGEQPWYAWDAALAQRDHARLQHQCDRHRHELEAIKALQFLFSRQWSALHRYATEQGICLFSDLPIYLSLDSADVWAHPELLLTGADGKPEFVAGVPPDYFSSEGQLWGNPLYDWDYHARHGYGWWIARLRHASSMSDLVRIDHFRAFESYWSVPAHASTARDGQWATGPGDAVFDALRAALGELPIVAEDLGIITAAVEALRDRQGIPGMRVLQFDILNDVFDRDKIAPNSVLYTGTHDNDTTVGWFQSNDAAGARATIIERTGGQPATIHTDMIRLAFSSAARLAIAPMQDYLGLGSAARLNRPGTAEHNWCWRLLPDQLTPTLQDSVAALVSASGRDHCN